MPNGGPTPDCFHCQFFRGDVLKTPFGPFQCVKHEISLPYAIRAFCSRYVRATTREEIPPGEDKLFHALIAEDQLRDDMMYLWLERRADDPIKSDELYFFHTPLAPIREYHNWTSEQFLEAMAQLTQRFRDG